MNWIRIKYRIKRRLRRHCIHCGARLEKYKIGIGFKETKIKRCPKCGKVK